MVYSFEPSVLNLSQIAKNVSINQVSDKIYIIPNPLLNKSSTSALKISSFESAAQNTFSVQYGFDGNKIKEKFQYQTLGFSIDDMLEKIIRDKPKIIKIDVDGMNI